MFFAGTEEPGDKSATVSSTLIGAWGKQLFLIVDSFPGCTGVQCGGSSILQSFHHVELYLARL